MTYRAAKVPKGNGPVPYRESTRTVEYRTVNIPYRKRAVPKTYTRRRPKYRAISAVAVSATEQEQEQPKEEKEQEQREGKGWEYESQPRVYTHTVMCACVRVLLIPLQPSIGIVPNCERGEQQGPDRGLPGVVFIHIICLNERITDAGRAGLLAFVMMIWALD